MKKSLFLGIISSLLLSSCSSNKQAESIAEEDFTIKEWKSVDCHEIKNNPVQLFANDWMLLSAGNKEDMNAMTIAWGTMGELWSRPVVIVYVSTSRYTYEYMEKNQYFTVTAFPESKRAALQYMGSHSGRDEDKITNAGLTPEFTDLGNPIFKESNLAIECKIIYSEQFDKAKLPVDLREWYDNSGTGVHVMYIGEIINAWEK